MIVVVDHVSKPRLKCDGSAATQVRAELVQSEVTTVVVALTATAFTVCVPVKL